MGTVTDEIETCYICGKKASKKYFVRLDDIINLCLFCAPVGE